MAPMYAANRGIGPVLVFSAFFTGVLQVDVWSMGVLLYALLCGCLPFDDSSNNMAIIYRKIQLGRFAVPKWLSVDSVELLHDLMQVNPRRRVTVRELVRHPWVVKGFGAPVSWNSNCEVASCIVLQF